MKKVIKLSMKKTDISHNSYPIDIIDFFLHIDHDKCINMLYLNQSFLHDKIIIKKLKTKLHGYKSQDTKKKRWDKTKFISYEELIEKLVISKLLCEYCRVKCNLISKENRDNNQWTLDRIDNDNGHNTNNVVISCLKCNLQKRRRNDKHFKFAKQMRIIKHI
tara:strand:- start:7179 stop:7664 length:486 start_codon:yes stop_codon:yes gene_type:complete